jgi:hypothetical protein
MGHIRIMAASTIPLLLTLAMTASGIAAPADLPSAPLGDVSFC